MKKNILFLFILLQTNCIFLNYLDLTLPESVNGKEAKEIIQAAAITGAGISVAIDGRVTSDLLLPFLSDKLAGIKESAFYDKFDVDKCAAEAQLINILTIKAGGFTCKMKEKEHKLLINWPIKLL